MESIAGVIKNRKKDNGHGRVYASFTIALVHYCSVLYEYQDTSTLYLDSIVYPSPSSASFSNNDDLILFFN